MNRRPQHFCAEQKFAPKHQLLDDAPRAVNDLPEFHHRVARETEAAAIPLAAADDPVFTPRPAFNQQHPVSFVSLSDRIASQTADHTPCFKPATAKRSKLDLKLAYVTATLSAVWQSSSRLAPVMLLGLVAVTFVYYFVTG